MNKRLPYEEELSRQLSDLPLPDENVSWEDMKRRLDEDNDDGVIIPPVQRGCLGYGLLILLLAVAIWFGIPAGKWPWNKNQKNVDSSQKMADKKEKVIAVEKEPGVAQENSRQPGPAAIQAKDFDSAAYNNKEHLVKDLLTSKSEKGPKQKAFGETGVITNTYEENRNKPFRERTTPDHVKRKKTGEKINKKITGSLKSEIAGSSQHIDSSKNYEKNITQDSALITTPDNVSVDSIVKKVADPGAIPRKINDNEIQHKIVKKDPVAKKPIYFAAGVALHQQLPVAGQKLVPYNSLGRKGTLADYIPSLYVRMYKDKKWFLQSEFRYGAPQYTKEIVYVQKRDSSANTTLSTSNRLKKTYYHQLPASFNYFVLPHFSIGAGFTWNKFSSAISEQEITARNNITQIDSVLVKAISHSKKADSNFVKSYFQALIETQYQWKRLSFGVRYSFGLQPYIRFQLQGGEHQEEKNSSLQVFIRYNLWESKKK